MLTKDDIKNLKEVFPTKEDLDFKLEKLSDDIDKKLDNQKKEILEGVAEHFHDSVLPILDNYEERLGKLEKKTGIHPTPIRQ